MPDMTYAVHTAACTYLLDDDGVCCAITVSPAPPPGSERCIGAQFVACLDMRTEGGLVGELRLGAAALFVAARNGRCVLLRTQPIERVEILGPGWTAPAPESDDSHSFAATPIYEHAAAGLPSYDVEETSLLDPRWSAPVLDGDAEPLDLEDFLSISVTEVTVSLPLSRRVPPPAAPANPGRRPR
jgi:hypothetical protein